MTLSSKFKENFFDTVAFPIFSSISVFEAAIEACVMVSLVAPKYLVGEKFYEA
jgi:hypothetical protein